jgi:hypothetical protein
MSTETLAMIWFIGGIVYAFVNGAIRKIDTDGDWLLPLGWVLLWPMMLPTVLIQKLYQKVVE